MTLAQDGTRSAAVAAALRDRPAARHKVWVYFRDKGPDAVARRGEVVLSPRALARRALRGDTRTVTVEDVPLVPAYVDAVAARVTRVRHQVPWVNAVSVEASAEQVAAVEGLPFVARVDLVRGYRGRPEEDVRVRARSEAAGRRARHGACSLRARLRPFRGPARARSACPRCTTWACAARA